MATSLTHLLLTRNMPHAEAASYLDKSHAGQPALLPSLVPQLGNFFISARRCAHKRSAGARLGSAA